MSGILFPLLVNGFSQHCHLSGIGICKGIIKVHLKAAIMLNDIYSRMTNRRSVSQWCTTLLNIIEIETMDCNDKSDHTCKKKPNG